MPRRAGCCWIACSPCGARTSIEPHRYRHVVGPIRLKAVEGAVAVVHSNFVAVRIMHDGATTLFASGRYLDRIDISTTPFRFSERIVVLDSDKIDTLLAIPL